MAKKYVRDYNSNERFQDFCKFVSRHPTASVRQIAAAYHISKTTAYAWLERIGAKNDRKN